jgi:hypothetical protein
LITATVLKPIADAITLATCALALSTAVRAFDRRSRFRPPFALSTAVRAFDHARWAALPATGDGWRPGHSFAVKPRFALWAALRFARWLVSCEQGVLREQIGRDQRRGLRLGLKGIAWMCLPNLGA